MIDTFSRRHQLDYEPKKLHYEYIPIGFRFDFFKLLQADASQYDGYTLHEYRLYRMLSIAINHNYIQLVGEDDIYEFYSSDLLVDLVKRSSWHQLLSMLEVAVERTKIDPEEINKLFNYHCVGYLLRKVEGRWLVETKYEAVIEEIEKAIESTQKHPKINALIEAARKNLADPNNIQIDNSITNSMQALEGFMVSWIKDNHALKCSTLGDVVKEIKSKKLADSSITESLHQFYIYRNRTPNIGHGSTGHSNASASEALLVNDMAVSFINYFCRKSP